MALLRAYARTFDPAQAALGGYDKQATGFAGGN